MQIDLIETHGFRAAMRGMRNSHESHGSADTVFKTYFGAECDDICALGDNDRALMERLLKSSSERKFLRMIVAWMDITAPLYWWKQFDTYRFGVEKNSGSTMYNIAKHPFTVADFACDTLIGEMGDLVPAMYDTIMRLNEVRRFYLEYPDNKALWRALVQLLPESYLQRRTVMVSYEALHKMYGERKAHKLQEWRDFCDILRECLPQSWLITGETGRGDH